MTVEDIERIASRILHQLHEEFEELRATIRGKSAPDPVNGTPPPRSMTVKTAAELYGVKQQYLRILCTRGTVMSSMVGGRHYVTPEEMDRVFLGTKSPLLKCKSKPGKRSRS